MEYKIAQCPHCCDLADLLFQTVKTGATRNAHNPRIRSAARPRESVISRQINNSGSSSVTRNFSNWVTLVRHFGFGSLSPRPCFLTPIARPLSSSARTLCFSSVVFASLCRLLFPRTRVSLSDKSAHYSHGNLYKFGYKAMYLNSSVGTLMNGRSFKSISINGKPDSLSNWPNRFRYFSA